MLKDPILDFIKLNKNLGINLNLEIKNEEKIKNKLTSIGILFETQIINEIYSKFHDYIIKIAHDYTDINIENSNLTLTYMKQGIPIIEQAVVYNHYNNTYGACDLLVRSDWINKLFIIPQLTSSEEFTSSPILHTNYHYRVIDIKITSLHLCSDGIHIQNNGMIPAYKGQLTIYNDALGIMQGYTPNKAYILTKSWYYEKKCQKYTGNNPFYLLGHINYEKFDLCYKSLVEKAIVWIKNLRINKDKWTCFPPSIPELYPNMCNTYDSPYHCIKSFISNKIFELTSLWMVGPKNRLIAHKNNIFKWNDPLCTPHLLGIYGKKEKILQQIIDINKNNKSIISPNKINNNDHYWKQKNKNDFYIDFETISLNIIGKDQGNLIFMIGVGYEHNNEFIYKNFHLSNLTKNKKKILSFIEILNNEELLLNDFFNFIYEKTKNPRFFGWGIAEEINFLQANKRHHFIWSNNNITWIDFCKVFTDEPIVINGSLSFGLKNIAFAMYNHKLISTIWDNNGPINGLHAMFDALYYYDTKKITILNKIIDYNFIDCKVVFDIVSYLRKYHI